MNIYDLYATNTTSEKTGVPVEVGRTENGDKIVFYVARFGGENTKALEDMAERSKPYASRIENGKLPNDISRRILAENTAATLITGWENVTDKDGNELPYSFENAVNLMIDLPELMSIIRTKASTLSIYLKQSDEEVAKN